MKRALLLLFPLLCGCPTTWGFRGEIRAEKARVGGIVVGQDGIASDALATIPNATVTCDGCPHDIELQGNGRFLVSLGEHYEKPKPIVLHVAAPGFEPVDLEVPSSGIGSQIGYPIMIIVLAPSSKPPAAQK